MTGGFRYELDAPVYKPRLINQSNVARGQVRNTLFSVYFNKDELRFLLGLHEGVQRIKNQIFQTTKCQDEGVKFYAAILHDVYLTSGT